MEEQKKIIRSNIDEVVTNNKAVFFDKFKYKTVIKQGILGPYHDRELVKVQPKASSQPFKPTKLVWNVFREDVNRGVINAVNVFALNWSMNGYIYEAYKEHKNSFALFSKAIDRALHEVWARCEYETVISPMIQIISRDEVNDLIKEMDKGHPFDDEHKPLNCIDLPFAGEKIDVYQQIVMNWEPFITYLWNNRKLIGTQLRSDYKGVQEYRKNCQANFKAYCRRQEQREKAKI